ncbi:MAG: lipocalin-like domain-containing protein [Acidobacteriota bacterium]
MDEKLVGTWRLTDYEYLRSDGERLWPFGQSAVGVITYTDKGFMSVQIMDSERPTFSSDNCWRATLAEMAAAFEGYLAYFGTYDVNNAEEFITHHIQGSLCPKYSGTDQIRYFKIEGERLTLRTPSLPAGDQTITGRLIWERVTT